MFVQVEKTNSLRYKWNEGTTTWGMICVSQQTPVFIEFLGADNLISFLECDVDEHIEIHNLILCTSYFFP